MTLSLNYLEHLLSSLDVGMNWLVAFVTAGHADVPNEKGKEPFLSNRGPEGKPSGLPSTLPKLDFISHL